MLKKWAWKGADVDEVSEIQGTSGLPFGELPASPGKNQFDLAPTGGVVCRSGETRSTSGEVVLEGLNKLVDLQRVDSQLSIFEEEYSAIPKKRENVAEALARCDERLKLAREHLQASGLEQRRVEQGLQEKEALLQRLDRVLRSHV